MPEPKTILAEKSMLSFIPDIHMHAGDYCQLVEQGKKKIGLCEIRGKRPFQEDTVACSAEAATLLMSFSDGEKRKLLEDTFKDLQHSIVSTQGSTACFTAAWLDPKTSTLEIWNANLGDSTAFVVIVDPVTSTAEIKQLNIPHTPHPLINQKEYQRLVDLGNPPDERTGWRLNTKNGSAISVSRSFGDMDMEIGGLLHDPDITNQKIIIPPHRKVYLVTACDGLTEANSMTPQSINELMSKSHRLELHAIAMKLVSQSFFQNSADNISVAVAHINKSPVSISIFDGHGGDKISKLLEQRFYPTLIKNMALLASQKGKWKKTASILLRLDAKNIQSLSSKDLAQLNKDRTALTNAFIHLIKTVPDAEKKLLLESFVKKENLLAAIIAQPQNHFWFLFTQNVYNNERVTASFMKVVIEFESILKEKPSNRMSDNRI
jgi:serine/threonine protein phosphatase PrpC